MTIEALIERILSGHRFSYGCFGDGELMCAMGRWKKNGRKRSGEGERYSDELQDALVKVLDDDQLDLYCLRPGKNWLQDGYRWAEERGYDKLPVIKKPIIRHAIHKAEGGGAFLAAVRVCAPTIVGPRHAIDLKFMKWLGAVELPPKNTFDKLDEVVVSVVDMIRRSRPGVVCFSAGLASPILIARVKKAMGLLSCPTLLDTGSIWDGFAGVWSRARMEAPEYRKNLQSNLSEMRDHLQNWSC